MSLGYGDRAQSLRKIGFGNYSEYLRSDLWERIRKEAFRRKGKWCRICGLKAQLIHHDNYSMSTLLGDDFRFLHPLCRKCHKKIEFDNGEKRSLGKTRSHFRHIRTPARMVDGQEKPKGKRGRKWKMREVPAGGAAHEPAAGFNGNLVIMEIGGCSASGRMMRMNCGCVVQFHSGRFPRSRNPDVCRCGHRDGKGKEGRHLASVLVKFWNWYEGQPACHPK